MRNPIFTGLLALAAVGSLAACDSFVEGIDQPIDRVNSDSLDLQREVDFQITGIKEGFNDAYDQIATLSDLLSDVGEFNRGVRNSTFPTFGDIDRGEIGFDNNSVDNLSDAVNEYRYAADDLLRRIDETITFSDDADGVATEARARFAANFHGAIARYFLATYFSEDGVNGGAPISTDRDDPGPVIPAATLYQQAQDKLAIAFDLGSAAQQRQINTLRARIALFQGDRGAAGAFAAEGMTQGDAPYVGRYTAASANDWWSQGGNGRVQISIARRFADYDAIDTRDLVVQTLNFDRTFSRPYYQQALYPTPDVDLPFITWQENALIQAEVALLEDADADAAEAFVNPVLADRGFDEIGAADPDLTQEALIQIRDRELFTQGQRLVDQRRFGLPFEYAVYAGGGGGDGSFTLQPLPGIYRYFPLTQTERNANPNL